MPLSNLLPATLLSTLLLHGATATPVSVKRHSSGIPFSSGSLPITGAVPRSHELSKRSTQEANVTFAGPLGGYLYTVPITIGTQNFTVRIDTGSADIWVHGMNVSCPASASQATDIVGAPDVGSGTDTNDTCYFATAGYDPSLSPTYHDLPYHSKFNQSYTGGKASGYAAMDDITMGGITVPQQEFAIINISAAAWGNVYTNDGIFGIAGSTLTEFYEGDAEQVTPDTVRRYNPWLFNAVNQSLIEPYFTIDLHAPTLEQRSVSYDNITDLGTFTIGGVPPDASSYSTAVTVPNIGVPAPTIPGGYAWYWAVNITSYDFPGAEDIPAQNNSSPQGIWDTGTSFSQLPAAITDAYHRAMDPPGTLVDNSAYFVACNATVPDLTITVGGMRFTARGSNFISGIPYTTPGALEDASSFLPEGQCLSGVQYSVGGSDTMAVIGDNFLWDIMLTADLEKNEITLIQKDLS